MVLRRSPLDAARRVEFCRYSTRTVVDQRSAESLILNNFLDIRSLTPQAAKQATAWTQDKSCLVAHRRKSEDEASSDSLSGKPHANEDKHCISHIAQIILFVCLGSLSYGYSASIIATTLGQPTFLSYFRLYTRSNSTQLQGAINGLFQGGGLLGTLSCIGTADRFGRRWALLINSVITVIGGGLQAGSVNMPMYLVARFITGWGIGALVTLVPLYQSEISPPKIRGLLVGMHGVLLCVGYALASWVGVAFYFVHAAGAQWRIPLAIQCIFPLILAAGILALPESPRWVSLTRSSMLDRWPLPPLACSRSSDLANSGLLADRPRTNSRSFSSLQRYSSRIIGGQWHRN